MIRRWLLAVTRYLRTPPSVTGSELDDSIHDELQFHLVESAREQRQHGTPPDVASRTARDAFGDTSRVARQCWHESLLDQLVCHRVHLVVTAVLFGIVATLAVLHFTKPDAMETVAGTMSDEGHDGDIVGRIVDVAGAPIEQAHILAVVKTWPDNGYRQQAHMATTSSDGRFVIADVYPVGVTFHVQIAAIAQQRVMQSQYVRSDGEELESIEFRLPATGQLTMRIEGADGVAVENAEVFPHCRQDSDGDEHLVYFQSADPVIRRTASDGTVAMPYFLPGDRATVYVRLPDGEWRTEEVIVPEDSNVIGLRLNDDQLSSDRLSDDEPLGPTDS